MTLTDGQQPLYASCGNQQNLSGVTVVGGGGTPENGFGSEGFFLGGEEVEPTSFLSSGYNAANHTAEGMIGNAEGAYAPQLAPAVVALLEAPCTVVLDVTFTGAGKGYILCDDAMYLEVQIGANLVGIFDGTGGFDDAISPGRHKMAFTRIDGSVTWSVDGAAIETGAGDTLATMGTIVLGVIGDTVPADTVLHEFTIYPPQDDADLPALSAL